MKCSPAWLQQLLRFGVVGTGAALTQLGLAYVLVSQVQLKPLVANVFAFYFAFMVSYFGHQYWTFPTPGRVRSPGLRLNLLRFFLVAVASFALNELLFFVFLEFAHLYYLFALAITLLIIPPLTFVTSKFWAFK